MASLTEACQANIRTLTGYSGNTLCGDWNAYCDNLSIPAGALDGRIIAAAQTFDATIKTASAAYNYFLQNPSVLLSGGYTYILDSLPAAAAAFSFRKLKSTYSGSSIRVRRSSDNAEQDIGFSSNLLDTAAMLTFIGANDGYIVTMYDQSGNTRDVTQSTASEQPKIVSSGAVILDNGKVGALSTGTQYLRKTTPGIAYSSHYIGIVATPTELGDFTDMFGTGNVGATSAILLMNYGGGNATRGHYWSAVGALITDYTPSPTTGSPYIFAQLATGTNFYVGRNGTLSSATAYSGTTSAPPTLNIGGRLQGGFKGYMKEIIVFDSTLSTADRNALERNQGTYYGITVA